MSVKGEIKQLSECKLNNLDFLNFDTKEKCYLFGLLCADGCLHIKRNTLALYTIFEDFMEFKNHMKEIPFSYYNVQHRGNRKLQSGGMIYSTHLTKKLIEIGFNKKSDVFSFYGIKEELIRYFLLGYFDGDGCFCYKQYLDKRDNKYYKHTSFNVSGTYEMNWTALENVFKTNNIEYRIVRYQSLKSSFSRIVISKRTELLKLINFVYDDFKFNSLNRKKLSAFSIKEFIHNKYNNEQ